ncbi:hypothetical protein [Kribbella sp. NPDC051620]
MAYDVPILPEWQAVGRPVVDRVFVIPPATVQKLAELPPFEKGEQW